LWAQVIDRCHAYGTQQEAQAVYDKVKEVFKDYGIVNEKDDVSNFDVMDGKLVDFNTFHFNSDWQERMAKKYCEYARYGKQYYHDLPVLGLHNAPRKTALRIAEMKLDTVDFKGKSVADYGCAGGAMCRYAKSRGALKVDGIDYPDCAGTDPIKGAYLASFLEGYHSIDYYSCDLRNGVTGGSDITFFLSMNYHIGIPGWLPDVTKELCVFEDNSKDRSALPALQKLFKRVDRIGETTDHDSQNPKIIYYCYKQ
jgi:hypothetical protein